MTTYNFFTYVLLTGNLSVYALKDILLKIPIKANTIKIKHCSYMTKIIFIRRMAISL